MYRDDKIREAMGRKNLNIVELSELSGVNRFTVSDLVNGKTESVNLSTLKKIADALEITLADLFEERQVA